jgi:hypothetical protein
LSGNALVMAAIKTMLTEVMTPAAYDADAEGRESIWSKGCAPSSQSTAYRGRVVHVGARVGTDLRTGSARKTPKRCEIISTRSLGSASISI